MLFESAKHASVVHIIVIFLEYLHQDDYVLFGVGNNSAVFNVSAFALDVNFVTYRLVFRLERNISGVGLFMG